MSGYKIGYVIFTGNLLGGAYGYWYNFSIRHIPEDERLMMDMPSAFLTGGLWIQMLLWLATLAVILTTLFFRKKPQDFLSTAAWRKSLIWSGWLGLPFLFLNLVIQITIHLAK
jgi:hypothetical protein